MKCLESTSEDVGLIVAELKEPSVVVYLDTNEAIDIICEGIIKGRDFQY